MVLCAVRNSTFCRSSTVQLCSRISQLHNRRGGAQHSCPVPLCVCACVEWGALWANWQHRWQRWSASKEKPRRDVHTGEEEGGREEIGRAFLNFLSSFLMMFPSWAVTMVEGAFLGSCFGWRKVDWYVFDAVVEVNTGWGWVKLKLRKASCHTWLTPALKTVSNTDISLKRNVHVLVLHIWMNQFKLYLIELMHWKNCLLLIVFMIYFLLCMPPTCVRQ